tara:strand:- start:6031 stop:6636 length:606 start_codon:yes stop_codon:yes gene_type:complete
MALFGGDRDVALIRTVNRELLNNIVDTTIDIFKISLYDTKANLYGEALNKIYKPGVRVASLITHEDQSWSSDEFGPDMTQTAQFAFLKYELQEIADVVLEVGDVIAWDEKYWEIDGVAENQYFMGKNNATTTAKEDRTIGDMAIGDPAYGTPLQIGGYQEVFGASLSIIVNTHQSRRSKLKIEEIRNGFTRKSKGPGVRGI